MKIVKLGILLVLTAITDRPQDTQDFLKDLKQVIRGVLIFKYRDRKFSISI